MNLNPANSLFSKASATQTGQEQRRIFVGLKVVSESCKALLDPTPDDAKIRFATRSRRFR